MAVQTESRIKNFYASWFGENNPLGPLTNGVAEEIDSLGTGGSHSREKLRFLVDDVRRLDALVSGGNYRWLREPSFDPATFPVISKGVAAEPFADPAFMQRINENGTRAFGKLKDSLFSVTTGPTGYVLANLQGEIKLDPEVNTAAANIDVLSTQDFMADSVAVRPLISDRPVIWHKDALGGRDGTHSVVSNVPERETPADTFRSARQHPEHCARRSSILSPCRRGACAGANEYGRAERLVVDASDYAALMKACPF